MHNRFNLIDEPWIPAIGKGLVSLADIFSDPRIPALGGNPVQKIALTKLLLAIGQAACTPETTEALEQLDAETFRRACRAYLEKWRDRFWLFGDKPFLQMPAILDWMESQRAAGILSETENAKQIGPGFYPSLPSENDSILSQFQTLKAQTDAEKALFIVSVMNFAFGGTQINKNIYPSEEKVKGKGKPAKPGPSLGRNGYLHTFLFGSTIIDTLIMNLLSQEEIDNLPFWEKGIGTPPWENMPVSRECDAALSLKKSYMGTLVSLSRFVLLHDDGIYYIDGLPYPSHQEGWLEPSMTIDNQQNPPKAILVNPEKRPWRELVSILAVFDSNKNNKFVCLFIKYGLSRWPKRYNKPGDKIGVWSGGLQVSFQTGEQYAKATNDFVESSVELDPDMWNNLWYDKFFGEISILEIMANKVKNGVINYYDSFEPKKEKKPKERASTIMGKKAVELFWQLCERRFPELVDACGEPDKLPAIHEAINLLALQSYDAYCPKETARQIDAWAECQKDLKKFIRELMEADRRVGGVPSEF
ncbi:MAG TPA: type I-E CRISPR-associated protein Cse1/CasA [Chlorobaculum sp.]|uniref:CRISPR-associated protein, CT1972 family n=1 Tax=Chlorobaculum tepidum (strain ATCC 49652 / DSM 12025 / NBRC 103806 / TLS) TaxID=194439 RepID=Q8KB26_CHLTE|nr:type I-E CRISPR-associated protein Cse1/CasA [Chlorobaculum tepidum]AAM73190.1 CRISPR-associated protein, CT1972 family [Chlorobaculum tepidum TLS]HBU23304.1 type I-E CRISPR-associated protein Cse1/CasA [Chlorobaculum sp.]